ncbi:MAG: C-GCAxxG-C-C family (seleno)protein, partial [Bacillota bacterium]
DADKEKVKKLRESQEYTIYKKYVSGEEQQKPVKGFEIYHTSDREQFWEKMLSVPLMVVAVYPEVHSDLARELAGIIEARSRHKPEQSLDIILCDNRVDSASHFRKLIRENLTNKAGVVEHFAEKVGLVESIIIRTAVEPEPEIKNEDSLAVVTSGYPEMPVDETAFRGYLHGVEGLRYTDNMRAEEIRKLYTYNMFHTYLAFLGQQQQYTEIGECINDRGILQEAKLALEEVGQALQQEYDFSEEDMESWNREVVRNLSHPMLRDRVDRVGTDPVRKLKRDDRLTGPALLCRKHGLLPYYLARGIAYGLMFEDEDQDGIITEYIEEHGAKQAIRHFTGLEREQGLINLIDRFYRQAISADPDRGYLQQDHDQVSLIKRAYKLGFRYEKIYKGCAQCTLLAMFEIIGRENPRLFQAASGLSGGIALCGDGSCGGYTGGVLLMGSLVGRRMEFLDDGDKEAQYKSYNMAQQLHDRFKETYGSVTCADIHEQIFGEAYCLRTKERRDEFEEAGAHQDKCTSLIGKACQWITEILLQEGLIEA